jgi:hypothetical protein
MLRMIITHCLDSLYCLLTSCLRAVFMVVDFLLQLIWDDNNNRYEPASPASKKKHRGAQDNKSINN